VFQGFARSSRAPIVSSTACIAFYTPLESSPFDPCSCTFVACLRSTLRHFPKAACSSYPRHRAPDSRYNQYTCTLGANSRLSRACADSQRATRWSTHLEQPRRCRLRFYSSWSPGRCLEPYRSSASNRHTMPFVCIRSSVTGNGLHKRIFCDATR